MKIRTQETCTKYETWEYEVADDFEFPEGFHDWNPEDKYEFMQSISIYDSSLIYSDWSGLGSVDKLVILG